MALGTYQGDDPVNAPRYPKDVLAQDQAAAAGAAAPAPLVLPDQDAQAPPPDAIGDIPPPPIPRPPAPVSIGPAAAPPGPRLVGAGVAGLPGTEGSTFARPGTVAARPFRTPAFFQSAPQRFGPGVPIAGGAGGVSGLSDQAGVGGLSPDAIGDLLRRLAQQRGGGGGGGAF